MRLADKLAEMNGPSQNGLSALYRLGVVTSATLTNYELFLMWEAYQQLPAYADQPCRIVSAVAAQCRVHRNTVYKAINQMTQPV